MYRLVLARMIMAHLNNKLTVYVNTEVCFGDHGAPLQKLVHHQSPKQMPSARAVRTRFPSGRTTLSLPMASLILIAPTCGPVNATIFPKSPAATSSTAVAPNIEQSARSNVVGDPPLPVAGDRGLRNQSDTAESAAWTGSRGVTEAWPGPAVPATLVGMAGAVGIGVVPAGGTVMAACQLLADGPPADRPPEDRPPEDWAPAGWPSGAACAPLPGPP